MKHGNDNFSIILTALSLNGRLLLLPAREFLGVEVAKFCGTTVGGAISKELCNRDMLRWTRSIRAK